MNKLPNEIIRQIRKFDSHPVADLFKEAVKTVTEELYETIEGDYEYGGEDSCHCDDMSFADFFFSSGIVIKCAITDTYIIIVGWILSILKHSENIIVIRFNI